jgi:hypothetical protein
MSIPDKSWQPPYVSLETTMGEVRNLKPFHNPSEIYAVFHPERVSLPLKKTP